MANTVVRLEITGQVQGVGFRWSMAEQARRLGVRGWVRNRRDGSVEAMVAGDSASVDQLIVWARKGPPTAAVEAVNVIRDSTETELGSFEQRPTA
ncbi:MAG TPA: acylphosphatase [Burkholderiaceae bacterium]|jgi:acylphosphatase|nr:acylphosphatase [Burkholderiaceae bacterium]